MQVVVGWMGRRRSWDVKAATAFFAYGAVAIAIAGAVVQTAGTLDHWREVRDVQAQMATQLLAIAGGLPPMPLEPSVKSVNGSVPPPKTNE